LTAKPPQPDPSPAEGRERLRELARFSHRALRITASTVAVVSLLRQAWIPAAAFAVAWLLLLQAPKVFPVLDDEPKPYPS
jgi:hypothetical protein